MPYSFQGKRYMLLTNEACIGIIGIQDICHFTSRDIGYYPFYFRGYRILCSISVLLWFLLKNKKQTTEKTTVKVPLKDESLQRNHLSERFFDLHNLNVLMASFYKQQEEFREIIACIYREGVEKPFAKWSFMSDIPSIQKDQPEPSLKTFICELKNQAWPLINMSRFGNKYVQSFSQLQTNNSRTRLSKGQSIRCWHWRTILHCPTRFSSIPSFS